MGQANHLLVVEAGALAGLDRTHASERYARHGVGDLALAEAASFAALAVSTSEVRQFLLMRAARVVVIVGSLLLGRAIRAEPGSDLKRRRRPRVSGLAVEAGLSKPSPFTTNEGCLGWCCGTGCSATRPSRPEANGRQLAHSRRPLTNQAQR